MHRIQNNLTDYNPQFRANIVGRTATIIADAAKEKFAANAATAIAGVTAVTVPAAVVLSQRGNINTAINNSEVKTNPEKEIPEKQPLPKYAEEHKEETAKLYQNSHMHAYKETLTQEEIESLLRCTENGNDKIIIATILLQHKVETTLELLKYPDRDKVNYLTACYNVFDKELNKYRNLSFEEIKNILDMYPNISCDVLDYLQNLVIPDKTLGELRNLTYDESLQVFKNTKICNKIIQLRKIGNESNDIVINKTNNTAEKIPRYIYHLTTKANYERMLKEGSIKTNPDEWFKNNVICAVELENLFKRWNHSKSWEGSIQQGLIEQVSKGQDDIVILKIPTSKLQDDKLFIRSQNRLLASRNNIYMDCHDIINSPLYKDKDNLTIHDIFDIINKTLNNRIAKVKNWNHISYGSPAEQSKLFKQRKEAIEYIYCDNIPMQNVEKIGEVNIGRFRQGNHYDIKSIFDTLLKGTPEANSIVLLTN